MRTHWEPINFAAIPQSVYIEHYKGVKICSFDSCWILNENRSIKFSSIEGAKVFVDSLTQKIWQDE